jgi:hypothetical protein
MLLIKAVAGSCDAFETPGIGILSADETTVARLGASGVLVWQVFHGGSAAGAGLHGTKVETGEIGDVITALMASRFCASRI